MGKAQNHVGDSFKCGAMRVTKTRCEPDEAGIASYVKAEIFAESTRHLALKVS